MEFVVYEVVCSELILPIVGFASLSEAEYYVAELYAEGFSSPGRYEIREEISGSVDYEAV